MSTHNQVLIIVGDATETVDTLYPFLRVQEEGFEPVVAGPEVRRYQMVLHEVPTSGWTITREYEGYTIEATIAFKDVDSGFVRELVNLECQFIFILEVGNELGQVFFLV